MVSRYKKPESQKIIAKERIEELFIQASKASKQAANKYVALARKIVMKYKIRMPKELKMQYCHKCYNYFKSSRDFTVRTSAQHKSVEYICKSCGNATRYGYSREKNEL